VIRFFHADTAELIGTPITHPGEPKLVEISNDGRWAATISPAGEARLWSTEDGKERVLKDGEGQTNIASVVFSPDSQKLLTISSQGRARLWSPETAAAAGVIEDLPVLLAEFSPDSQS